MLTTLLLAALVPLVAARPAFIEWGDRQGFLYPVLTPGRPPRLMNGNAVAISSVASYDWTFGQNQVILHKPADTTDPGEWCIDAGLEPQEGTRLKIWRCYRGTPQQTWNVADGQIKLAGTNLCMDVPSGNMTLGYVQLWTCDKRNSNQIFGEFCGSRGSGPYPSGG